MYAYSDRSRENDPHALPCIETFYMAPDDIMSANEPALWFSPGWYWWSCFPGTLPNSEPVGPFETADAALQDARDY